MTQNIMQKKARLPILKHPLILGASGGATLLLLDRLARFFQIPSVSQPSQPSQPSSQPVSPPVDLPITYKNLLKRQFDYLRNMAAAFDLYIRANPYFPLAASAAITMPLLLLTLTLRRRSEKDKKSSFSSLHDHIARSIKKSKRALSDTNFPNTNITLLSSSYLSDLTNLLNQQTTNIPTPPSNYLSDLTNLLNQQTTNIPIPPSKNKIPDDISLFLLSVGSVPFLTQVARSVSPRNIINILKKVHPKAPLATLLTLLGTLGLTQVKNVVNKPTPKPSSYLSSIPSYMYIPLLTAPLFYLLYSKILKPKKDEV